MISVLSLIEAKILPSLEPKDVNNVVDRVTKKTEDRLSKRQGTVLMHGKEKLLGKTPLGSK